MTTQFFMNVLLSLIWVMLSGNTSIANFGFGYVIGFLILYLTVRGPDNRKYFYRVPRILRFLLHLGGEVIKSNYQVTRTIFKPNLDVSPGIVKYPMESKTDLEITMLTYIISLTPGTLVIDVSDDKKVMYIHGMYIEDKDAFIQYIRLKLEMKLLATIR